MNLNPFKKEKYSKEAYENAKGEARIANKLYGEIGGLHHIKSAEKQQEIYDELISDVNKSERKVEKIFEAGRKEATELNKEYDKKVKAFQDAAAELAKFRIEKLEMKDKDEVNEMMEKDLENQLKETIYTYSQNW